MRPFLVYTAMRIGLFVAALGVLWLVGARGFLLLFLALVVSFALSFVLLRRQRDAVTLAIMDRAEARRLPEQQKRPKQKQPRRSWSQRIAADAEAEDAALDAVERGEDERRP